MSGAPGAGKRTSPALRVLLAVAALLRCAAVLLVPWRPAFDDDWYFTKGIALALGNGYVHLDHPTAFFPVGYPATLALLFEITGPHLLVAQLLNVALSVSTMWIVYAVARRLTRDTPTSLLAAALFGFLPNQIMSCCVTMSEITFTFVVMLGILTLLRRPWWRPPLWGILVGGIFGWATLIRPQALFLPFLLAPGIAIYRDRMRPWSGAVIRQLVAILVGLLLTVGPWTYRNYRVFGTFVLVSTNGGENLLIGNSPGSIQRVTPPIPLYPEGVHAERLSEIERDELGASVAKEYIRSHPIRVLSTVPRKLWYMYRSDLGVTNWLWDAHGGRGTLPYYLTAGVTEGLYLLVLAAAFSWMATGVFSRRSSGDGKLLLYLVTSMTAYFTLITAVFFGDARYHQPLMPLLSIAAAAMMVSLWRAAARRARGAIAEPERFPDHDG